MECHAHTIPVVPLPAFFAIQADAELTGTENLPAALLLRQCRLHTGHQRVAERHRVKRVAWGWGGVTANGWNMLLVYIYRVILLHIIPSWTTTVRDRKSTRLNSS